ncbi:MAG: ABC transporter ATP-binding protein [Acidimicrobiia bacterium]
MLTVQGLRAGHGGLDVVHGVDLAVAPGHVVSLVGPNGAGKSTVARCTSGLLRPRAGRIEVDGHDVTQARPEERVRHGLAMVPEDRALFPGLSVHDNLLLGAYRRNRPNAAAALARVEALFPRLAERRGQHAGSLSGGEQQMLAIGRALMSDPRYLVLDEPSLGLAPLLVSAILTEVRALADAGVGVLLVEQNAVEALRVSDSALVLERGHVVLEGPAAELRDDERIASSYLGLGAR